MGSGKSQPAKKLDGWWNPPDYLQQEREIKSIGQKETETKRDKNDEIPGAVMLIIYFENYSTWSGINMYALVVFTSPYDCQTVTGLIKYLHFVGGQPVLYQRSHTSEVSTTWASSIFIFNETPDE